MMKFGPEFFWTAVNLILLYIVLRKVLFKRVTEFMEERSNGIKSNIDSANRSREEAESMKRQYEEQLAKARDEAGMILDDARIRAGKEHDEIISKAKQEAEAIMEKARQDMEYERDRMLKEIKGQVAGLALAAASKVIEANMDTESNRMLINKFIDEEGAA